MSREYIIGGPISFFVSETRNKEFVINGVLVDETSVQQISPDLFTHTSSFYAPTVTPGVAPLTPGLFTNASSFFSPTVAGFQPLNPNLFTSTSIFYSPTLVYDQTLEPALFSNAQTFFSLTIDREGLLTFEQEEELGWPPKPLAPQVAIVDPLTGKPTVLFHEFQTKQYEWLRKLVVVLNE